MTGPMANHCNRFSADAGAANGRTLTGHSHDYTRHGTTTLFAALNVATGEVRAGHYARRRRVEFLDFMNKIVADHPDRDIHVVLDNLNTAQAGRPDLARAVPRSDGSKGGRPAFDHVFMWKILILQASHSLSDERTEFLIKDRLSFMRFLELELADAVPDANTIWTFREALTRATIDGKPAIETLFRAYEASLTQAGFLAMGGQIIDASIVAAPKQRNSAGEKADIKAGRIPQAWKDQPAKLAQKRLLLQPRPQNIPPAPRRRRQEAQGHHRRRHAQDDHHPQRHAPRRRSLAAPNRLSQHSCSFDHLVGLRLKRERNGEAERACRLEIDDQLELGGPLDGQVGGFRALQDLVDIGRGLPVHMRVARPVGHQAAGLDELAVRMHARQTP